MFPQIPYTQQGTLQISHNGYIDYVYKLAATYGEIITTMVKTKRPAHISTTAPDRHRKRTPDRPQGGLVERATGRAVAQADVSTLQPRRESSPGLCCGGRP